MKLSLCEYIFNDSFELFVKTVHILKKKYFYTIVIGISDHKIIAM